MIDKGGDTLLIGFDKSKDDTAVLVVGRKGPRAGGVTIVNAFQGEAAIDIYNMLTTKVTPSEEASDHGTEEL